MRAQVSDLDLRLLRIFLAVVDAKGLSEAQATLNIGQPTISTHLATLEARVGFRLCERGRSGFHLTPKGEKFVAAARGFLNGVTDFGNAVRNMDKTLVGQLRLGLIDHAPTALMQQISASITAFRKRSEAVRFSIAVRPPRDLEEQLIHGEVDLVFSYFWRRLPSMEYRYLFKERQIACCGHGHPLFPRAGSVTSEEAAEHEWTWRSYPLPNTQLVRPHESVTAVADDMEAVAILIMSGRYLGYLPEQYAAPYIDKKLLAPLNPRTLTYDVKFELVYRRPGAKDEVLSTFLQDLKSRGGVRN
ncbi:MAG: LysR family transcriptional regulator [Acidobacteriaceae bacterium]|jgi:DNA-binding transcriptional LysR family regulator